MSVRVKLGAYRYVMDMILRLKIPKPRTRWSATADTDSGIEHSLSDLTERLHPGVIRTRIVGMKQSLSDVRTFTLSPEAGYILPCFQAGQYASVKFMIDDHAVTRPYIISSAPTDAAKDNVIELTIQKREGGYVSEYIWENWKKGVVVRIDAPFGQGFYNGIRDADHIVGIASGIGSAYFRSIIREMIYKRERPQRLTLLFSADDCAEMLFRTEFDELASQSGGRVKIVCGSDGFLTADNIRMWVPDFAEASFYVCGQPSFSEPISKVLDDLLIRKTRRRITLCGQPGDIERHKQFPEGHDGKTYTITVLFGINRREIPARSLETVAVALERAGLAIDTRCRSGTCGWCRSKLESGMIWQRPEGDGVRAKDRDAGYFHPCSAYPISDLTVRVFTRL